VSFNPLAAISQGVEVPQRVPQEKPVNMTATTIHPDLLKPVFKCHLQRQTAHIAVVVPRKGTVALEELALPAVYLGFTDD
jgi:hypothetical protein